MAERDGGIAVVVVAAGSGRRFADAAGPPKQYRELLGVPLLLRALRPFLDRPDVDQVVLVLPAADVESPPEWLDGLPVTRVAGGSERGESVQRGLALVRPGIHTVLIHDGVRPLVAPALVDRLIEASRSGAAIPALRVTDTLKEVAESGIVVRTVDRSRFWCVQTPQAFPLAILRDAYRRAAEEGVSATDDAALLERHGVPVRVIEGDPLNVKVTTAADLALAEILARRLPGFAS